MQLWCDINQREQHLHYTVDSNVIGSLAATKPKYVLFLQICATSWWCSTQVQTKLCTQQFCFSSSSGKIEIKDVKVWFCCPVLLLCWDIPSTHMVWHVTMQIRQYNFFRVVKRKVDFRHWSANKTAAFIYSFYVFEDVLCILDTSYVFLKSGQCKLYQPLQSHQTQLSKAVL